MFEQSVVQPAEKTRTGYTFLASSLLQAILLGLAALVPVMYSNPLPTRALMSFLAAPAPPPAAAPAARSQVQPSLKRQFDRTQLMQPGEIPRRTLMLSEEEAPVIRSAGGEAISGVPGGLGDTNRSDVITRILAGSRPDPPPVVRPEPAARPKPPSPAPVQVGGEVQRAKQIYAPLPAYPLLARQGRISGVVRLNALIGKDGTIENLTVVSGPPLLIRAALEAVRQWRYRPTLLNGEPVEVATQIEVHFTLSQ